MVTFLLGNRRYRIGKLHRFDEILERKFFGYLFEIFCQRPAFQMSRKRRGFHRRHRLRTPFARDTFLLRQIHPATLSRATIVLMKIPLRKFFAVCEVIFDTILPLRGRSARTKGRTAEEIPLCPTVHELLGARITTLMDYRQSEGQDLIRSLKYDGGAHAAKLAAELLADFLREETSSHR